VIGFVALHQSPNLLAVLGIGLVVAAGIGAERSGARATSAVPDDDEPSRVQCAA
jgi:inner membrane transporter RhtA